MKTKRVVVLPYNPKWKTEFERIKGILIEPLTQNIISIEHVGSTSVEGLPAKPIIDIDIVIENYLKFDAVKSGLEDLGYRHEGDLGIAGREAFRYDDKPELMLHHLYVCTKDSEELHRHITFRDYLRTHAEERTNYGVVKLEAAKLYPMDIDSYILFKSPCIEEIYKKCGLSE